MVCGLTLILFQVIDSLKSLVTRSLHIILYLITITLQTVYYKKIILF